MAPRKSKKGKKPAKKSMARKSPTKRKSSKKMSPGKKVASPTFGGKKFDCRGRKVRSGKKTAKVARVFCKRMKPKK